MSRIPGQIVEYGACEILGLAPNHRQRGQVDIIDYVISR